MVFLDSFCRWRPQPSVTKVRGKKTCIVHTSKTATGHSRGEMGAAMKWSRQAAMVSSPLSTFCVMTLGSCRHFQGSK